jgi:hypothetical protein
VRKRNGVRKRRDASLKSRERGRKGRVYKPRQTRHGFAKSSGCRQSRNDGRTKSESVEARSTGW